MIVLYCHSRVTRVPGAAFFYQMHFSRYLKSSPRCSNDSTCMLTVLTAFGAFSALGTTCMLSVLSDWLVALFAFVEIDWSKVTAPFVAEC